MRILEYIREHLKDILVPLGAAVLGAVATLGVATTDYWHKDQQLKIQMLNIALGILREDPEKSKIAAVRGWAVDIINVSAPVKIPDDARRELIQQRIRFNIIAHSMGVASWEDTFKALKEDQGVPNTAVPTAEKKPNNSN